MRPENTHRTLLTRFLLSLGIVTALSACQAGAPGDGALVIRFPQAVNEMHLRVASTRTFATRLEAETGGRLRVEIFSGGQLYGARQGVLAAAVGDVEMAMEPETHFITFDDTFKAVDIPFVFDTEEKFQKFMNGAFRSRVAESLRSSGLILLALWDEGPMVLASRERLLRRPEDFSGVKIRSSGHELLARAWNEIGAATIRIPVHEVYTALQQGVADAIYTTLNVFVSSKIYEVAPKALLWPSRATYVWVIHGEFWNRMSEEDRQIIQRLVEEATADYNQALVDEYDGMVHQVREARGGELEELTPAELDAFRFRLADLLANWRSEYASVLGDIAEERGS
jgi:TRAP-type C4-dicarboxylate transport system substrate-binding protein